MKLRLTNHRAKLLRDAGVEFKFFTNKNSKNRKIHGGNLGETFIGNKAIIKKEDEEKALLILESSSKTHNGKPFNRDYKGK